MGLPKEDLPQINRWAEMNTSGQDPDLNPESYANPQNPSRDMAIYAMTGRVPAVRNRAKT